VSVEERVARLEAMVVEREAVVAEREAMLAERDVVIAELRSRIAELEAQLGQDSGNSSAPPSRDKTDRRARRAEQAAQRKARRAAGGKPRSPGKQPGSPGSTLERRAPTATRVHVPQACRCCGGGLADAPVTSTATRQVLEIPEPRLEVTDHVAERRRCACGAETTAVFPAEAVGAVCWGPRARAAASYLMARQHLPLERCAEAMEVLFDAPMGEGTLAGVLPDAASRLARFMARLADLLGKAPVVHADETSTRVGVRADWVHTISTEWLTYLAHHRKRGLEAIEAIGVLNNYTGTIVHDGLATYDKLGGATHAQCCAHILRYLDKTAKTGSQWAWATSMRGVLLDAKCASERAAAAGRPAVDAEIVEGIRHRYRHSLLAAFANLPPGRPPPRKHRGGWSTEQREAWNLATRMRACEDQVLRLLVDTRVRFDNNEAERSLRMAKLHDKISGHFRSETNAKAFMTVRSYLQTGAKHGHNALDLLTMLWTTGAWLPTAVSPAID